jgi:hypothetical protein
MKKLILCLLLSSSIPSFCQEITRVRDRIILSDRSCAVVMDVTKSLSDWMEKSIHDKSKSCPINLRSPVQKNGKCTYDITDCVPDHVVKYQGVNPKYQGPNCFNLTLVMNNILPALRYVSPDEVAFYLNPPICRELKNEEKREAGDIGAIRQITVNKERTGAMVDEYHAFVYISDKIAYSKNGYAQTSPYGLLPLEKVYELYNINKNKECRENELNPRADCKFVTSYFRCISMEEYLAQTKNVSVEVKNTFATLEGYEQCLEKKMMSATPVSAIAQNNVKDSVMALAVYLNAELEKNNTEQIKNKEQNFVLASIRLKLAAIADQFEMTKSPKSFEDFTTFSKVLKNISDKYRARIRESK